MSRFSVGEAVHTDLSAARQCGSIRLAAVMTLRTLTPSLALILAVLGLACGGGSASPPRSSPQPTATPMDPWPPQTEVDRILEYIRVLSEEIGPRLPGSPEEEAVIGYAREQFERWGYQVEVQSFSISDHLLRTASLIVELPERREIQTIAFLGAAPGAVSGRLLDAGAGRPEEFPTDAAGAVVLVQWREAGLVDTIHQAEHAGARAVVVASREMGLFQGSLELPSALPVVAIDEADGDLFRELLARGPVELNVTIEEAHEVTAHNIIARPDGSGCRTLTGGHFDSVPVGAGANDNASGAAMVLELARAAAIAGLSGHCFALFGAEETGLDGSRFFISELGREEQDELVAVFIYDVVAGDGQLLVSGSANLEDQAQALAKGAGLDAEHGLRPGGIVSDHVSFLEVGIPALLLTTSDFDRVHTVGDTLANLRPAALEEIAALGLALLREVSEGL